MSMTHEKLFPPNDKEECRMDSDKLTQQIIYENLSNIRALLETQVTILNERGSFFKDFKEEFHGIFDKYPLASMIGESFGAVLRSLSEVSEEDTFRLVKSVETIDRLLDLMKRKNVNLTNVNQSAQKPSTTSSSQTPQSS